MGDTFGAHPTAPVREPKKPGVPKRKKSRRARGVHDGAGRPERRMPQAAPPMPVWAPEGAAGEGWRPIGLDDYEETVAQSFPASDPPPGTMHAGPPRRRR